MAIAVSTLLLSLLICRAVLASLCHFYCHAILIAAVQFIAVQPAIIAAFQRLVHSFVEFPFLIWSCRRHINFAAKDVFVVTIVHRPIFFAFLVVILLVIFMLSCCSYRHCLSGSNSYAVVLSKPASYSPALFSIPVKRREHTYKSFIIVYGTRKVKWLYGYSTLAGAVKVRLRYGGSTR